VLWRWFRTVQLPAEEDAAATDAPLFEDRPTEEVP
jgi:hypothetical protein